MNMRTNIALADRHPLFLRGVRCEFEDVDGFQVVGAAHSSAEVVDLLRNTKCDVLVAGYTLPGCRYGSGLDFLSFLRCQYPKLKIVAFTEIGNPLAAREMMSVGVDFVLSKMDDSERLVSAVRAVLQGASGASTDSVTQVAHAGKQLSWREAEVIQLYMTGLQIGEIARRLHRAKQTVSSQKMNAMRKLGVDTDAGLFRFAFEVGQLQPAGSASEY
ncbi:response regulator [Paraburkholderia aspalathi]|uniref:response regulator n=1 Tax=Paraburkholderia aspalathi TaxID=1324617 RepID=UPI0038BB2816